MNTKSAFTMTREQHPAWRMQVNGRKCPYCQRVLSKKNGGNPPSRDHAYPISRGGSHTILNIEFTCGPCNSDKGSLTSDEYHQVRNGEASRLDKLVPERRKFYPKREWVFLPYGLILYPVRRDERYRIR